MEVCRCEVFRLLDEDCFYASSIKLPKMAKSKSSNPVDAFREFRALILLLGRLIVGSGKQQRAKELKKVSLS